MTTEFRSPFFYVHRCFGAEVEITGQPYLKEEKCHWTFYGLGTKDTNNYNEEMQPAIYWKETTVCPPYPICVAVGNSVLI
jgi:hypothetical protein